MNAPVLSTVLALLGLGFGLPAVPLDPVVEESPPQAAPEDGVAEAAAPGDSALPVFARPPRSLDHTIHKVEQMVFDSRAQQTVKQHGLSLVNVTWEDTGRYKGSSVGPNISDMTIGVRDHSGALHPMPVIRFDNFSDTTADLKMDDLWVLSGNARGQELRPTSLTDLLSDLRSHLHEPGSWKGSKESLLAPERDSHVIVSAQAALLPIPRSGQATFTPVIYNYQSYPGAPAVMTIVATREGSSVQVVENDEGYMSEPLYFNADGERAPYTAMRLSDFQAQGGDATTPGQAATADAGLDTVLIIQVPLKQRPRPRRAMGMGAAPTMETAPMAAMDEAEVSTRMEQAVIGHGATEGPFTEIHDLAIERDPRFPVRVTVQMYKATTTGTLNADDVAAIRTQIDRIYESGDYVGSLVTGGVTERPTEWVRTPQEHAVWARPWSSWHKAQ